MLKKAYKHFLTVTKHKYYVFRLSIKAGIPVRGFLHDFSKYSFTEFWESAKYYTDGKSSPITNCKRERGYSKAWLHHKGKNKHHHEYWYDYETTDEVPVIPYKYTVEMICDQLAAGITYNGKNPLEITAVHPESYEVAEQLLNIIGFKKEDLLNKEKLIIIKNKLSEIKTQETAEELNVGEITLKDIMQELSKPGRDPREDMPKPVLRADVLKFEDLKEGMILTGTVRNVTDFGAFVDVGVKHDGLVHISQLSNSFVKNPSDVVSVGDVVKVKIIGIDEDRKKAQLSMKI